MFSVPPHCYYIQHGRMIWESPNKGHFTNKIKAMTIAIYELSLVERAKTVQVHFTHEGEGLNAQSILRG